MWEIAAEIIEAPVEYPQVKGTIDDQVIGEDRGTVCTTPDEY